MSLTIAVTPEDSGQPDRVRVSLSGRLDSSTSDRLEEALKPVLAGRVRLLIMDFAGLEFISSMGIRVVVMSQKALSTRGGSVLLINMPPQIRKVMEIIDALPGLTVFRDTDEMDEYLALFQQTSADSDSSVHRPADMPPRPPVQISSV